MNNLSYGIGIELVEEKSILADIVAKATEGKLSGPRDGQKTNDGGKGVGRFNIEDPQEREWGIGQDNSIGKTKSSEIVTPMLTYKDLPVLEKVCKAIANSKAKANDKCAINVRVSGPREKSLGIDNDQNGYDNAINRLLANFWVNQNILYEAFEMPKHRNEGSSRKFIDTFIKKILAAQTDAERREAWYNQRKPKDWKDKTPEERKRMNNASTDHHYSSNHGINIDSYYKRGTIEYKLFTTPKDFNPELIKAYVEFCTAFTKASLDNLKMPPLLRKKCSKRYSMRKFLEGIGLEGDEYEKTRELLSRHLSNKIITDAEHAKYKERYEKFGHGKSPEEVELGNLNSSLSSPSDIKEELVAPVEMQSPETPPEILVQPDQEPPGHKVSEPAMEATKPTPSKFSKFTGKVKGLVAAAIFTFMVTATVSVGDDMTLNQDIVPENYAVQQVEAGIESEIENDDKVYEVQKENSETVEDSEPKIIDEPEEKGEAEEVEPEPEPIPELTHTISTMTPNGLDGAHTITYHTFDTGVPGPSIVIMAGVHGNEIAPPLAAQYIVDNFDFTKGRFLIIPKASPSAIQAGTRYTGGYGHAHNLNRQFPGNAQGNNAQRTAAAIIEIMTNFESDGGIDAIIDLHEARLASTWETSQELVNTILFCRTNEHTLEIMRNATNFAVDSINATNLIEGNRPFRLLEVDGSRGSTHREFPQIFNAPSFLTETGRQDPGNPQSIYNPVGVRKTQQLYLVKSLVEYFKNMHCTEEYMIALQYVLGLENQQILQHNQDLDQGL